MLDSNEMVASMAISVNAETLRMLLVCFELGEITLRYTLKKLKLSSSVRPVHL